MRELYNEAEVAQIQRSRFDLSHKKMFDLDLGRVVPVLMEEMLPGDVAQFGIDMIIRAQALVAPIYHKLTAKVDYFYSANRLVWEDWEKFVTKGIAGTDATALIKIGIDSITDDDWHIQRWGVWDYLGLPMMDPATGAAEDETILTSLANLPVHDLPWRHYWAIWRDWYRDETIQTQYPDAATNVGQDAKDQIDNLNTFIRNFNTAAGGGADNYLYCDECFFIGWKKDYFTTARTARELGTGVSIPIDNNTSALWVIGDFLASDPTIAENMRFEENNATSPDFYFGAGNTNARDNALAAINNNTVTLTTAGITIHDLRESIATQVWLERNNKAGYRYGEQIRSHFNVKPMDLRLGKPAYLGSYKTPVVISEIIQSSETNTTPQGTLAGHGMGVSGGIVGRYRATEHGYLVGLLSITAEPVYQQGIPRQFTRSTAYDFYFPEFDNISEQAILKQELFYTRDGATTDQTTFGYQMAWDEYRVRRNVVCGKLASALDHWTMARRFASAPSLNEAFLTTEYHSINRRDAFAHSSVQDSTWGQFFVQCRNNLHMIRPLPFVTSTTMGVRL